MKTYRLKKWVVYSIYGISALTIILGVATATKSLNNIKISDDESEVIYKTITQNDVYPVINEESNVTVKYPFLKENINVTKNYYELNSTEEDKTQSIIMYKDTYMENTGVLYTSNESFDVVSVLDGIVTSITQDEILGKVIEITHTNDLITIYQCLSEVNVKEGDTVHINDIIGKSGYTSLDNGYENSLLFEVNYNGQLMNPNKLYSMNINEFN